MYTTSLFCVVDSFIRELQTYLLANIYIGLLSIRLSFTTERVSRQYRVIQLIHRNTSTDDDHSENDALIHLIHRHKPRVCPLSICRNCTSGLRHQASGSASHADDFTPQIICIAIEFVRQLLHLLSSSQFCQFHIRECSLDHLGCLPCFLSSACVVS